MGIQRLIQLRARSFYYYYARYERFLAQEMALFKFRLERISYEQRKSFMSENDLDFLQVLPQELVEKRDILMTVSGIQTVERYEREEFFKFVFHNLDTCIHTYIHTYTCIHTYIHSYRIPFQQALSLMASRSVYLEKGFAYVPLKHLVSIIVTRVDIHTYIHRYIYIYLHTVHPLIKILQLIGNNYSSVCYISRNYCIYTYVCMYVCIYM